MTYNTIVPVSSAKTDKKAAAAKSIAAAAGYMRAIIKFNYSASAIFFASSITAASS